jgi:hypothetical protein
VFLEAGFDALSIFDFGQFEVQVMKKKMVEDDEEEPGSNTAYMSLTLENLIHLDT